MAFYTGYSSYQEVSFFGGQSRPCRPPNSLTEVLAAGKVPKLTKLWISEDLWCLKNEDSSAQLISAVLASHFSRLQDLFVEGGVHVALFWHAFRARLEGATMENLSVGPVLHREQYWVGSRYFGPLSELLELPCYTNLRFLDVYRITSFSGNNRDRRQDFELAVEEQLTILPRDITYTKGAPCLQELSITLVSSGPDFGPLVALLMGKGAPNLHRLTILNISALALQQLRDIYSAGGLAKVTVLHLWKPTLLGSHLRAWMDGVLAPEHRGAALESLHFYISGGTGEDACAASQVLVEALSAGATSNL